MILKKLQINHYGPFSQMTTIDIDPEVTILTGRNDVGKSAILNVIKAICTGQLITQNQVNVNRLRESSVPIAQDKEIVCIATFVVFENHQRYLTDQGMSPGSVVDICFYLTSGKKKGIALRNHQGQEFSAKFNISNLLTL